MEGMDFRIWVSSSFTTNRKTRMLGKSISFYVKETSSGLTFNISFPLRSWKRPEGRAAKLKEISHRKTLRSKRRILLFAVLGFDVFFYVSFSFEVWIRPGAAACLQTSYLRLFFFFHSRGSFGKTKEKSTTMRKKIEPKGKRRLPQAHRH